MPPMNIPANYLPQAQGLGSQYMSVPVTSDELYANQLQDDKIKNVIAQISPDNQLQEIEMRVRGYKKNFNSGEWEKINAKAKEPDPELVNNYISWLSSIMNQNTTMGNLSSVQITKLMKLAIEWLVDDIDANAEKYGIQNNYSERTRIGQIMLNSTFLVLNRSLNGMEARRMWSSLSLMESSNPTQLEQQKGEWWKFWKR